MSVFYHSGDPLLTTPTQSFSLFQSAQNPQSNQNLGDAYAQMCRQQMMMEMQQKESMKDWLSELDSEMKGLDDTTVEALNSDIEFSSLNSQLQGMIQKELMNVVKMKINANSDAVGLIRKQIDIMRNVSQKVRSEEKQSINELNDYLKNYSHMSFNEYKRLKDGDMQEKQETVEIKRKNKK